MARVGPAVNRDRSLDEFRSDDDGPGSDGATGSADGSGTDGDAASVTDEQAEVESVPDATADDGADPAEPTYAWSPDGAACAVCGDATGTRWRQDGAYVCPDCKEW